MKKSLQDLLSEGLIEPFTSTHEQIEQKIKIAEEDIKTAKISVTGDARSVEWAYTQAYNAILQSGTALMYSENYRPKKSTGKHHWTVEKYVKIEFSGRIPQDALDAFTTARQGRHMTVYEQTGTISRSQAQEIITKAEIFVSFAKSILSIF